MNICLLLYIFIYCAYFTYFTYLTYLCPESLFNIKEDFRAQPTSWYDVGWMPIVDESKSLRPGQGYDCDAARNMRIHHECWRQFLRVFVETTKARVIVYGDGKARQTRHSIGAVLGDQQVFILDIYFVAYQTAILYILTVFCIFYIFRNSIR